MCKKKPFFSHGRTILLESSRGQALTAIFDGMVWSKHIDKEVGKMGRGPAVIRRCSSSFFLNHHMIKEMS